jgi:hypothetical protein
MKLHNWMLTLAAGAMLVGCQANKTAVSTAPAVDDATYAALKSEFEAVRPGSLVGRVIKVAPAENAAEIADLPAGQFRAGEVLLFIDAQQNSLAYGTVFLTTPETVMVKYTVEEGGRAPVVGDVAVRLARN